MLEVAVTRLEMDNLSEQQLAEYLESGRWEGKAGAFGYQDGNDWLRILDGSPSNVVGLPMELLSKMLAALNRSTS
jgi:septum formation protein